MVFSSVPVYLDPSNWQVVQQQPNYEQQHTVPGGIDNYHPAPTTPPPPPPDVGGGSGSVRPNSMVERARLAKIPQPETALKCPRCESINTKFCYYNNYNLSQPRHFCKTCRRYWTRGGALRSVPVGGGIRRNKRNKTSSRSSKSCCSATDQQHQTGSSSTTSTTTASSNTSINTNDFIGGHLPPHPQLPFLSSLQYNLTDFDSTGNIGFNFGDDLQSQVVTAGSDVDNDQFQNIGDSTNGVGSVLSSGFVEQLRLQQQFPLLANLDPHVVTGLYPFQTSTENNIELVNQQLIRSKLPLDYGVTRNSTNVKMEENNNQGLNLSRNFLGSLGINEQYWGNGSGSGSGSSSAWTDLSSGFTSS